MQRQRMSYGLLSALSWGISGLLATVAAWLMRQQVGGAALILVGLVLLGFGS
jgi:hypothetical protein